MMETKSRHDRERRISVLYRNKLRGELDQKIKQLPAWAQKQIKDTIKKKSRLLMYEITSSAEARLNGHADISMSVLRSKLEIASVYHNRIAALRTDVWPEPSNFRGVTDSPLERHNVESKNTFRREAQTIRPSMSVVMQEEMHFGKSHVTQVKGSEKNVVMVAKVSPAWSTLIRKIGSATIKGRYLIVNATRIKQPFFGASLYVGEVVDLKGDVEILFGYFGIYMSDNMRITSYDKDMVRAERLLRSSVARATVEEMTE